MNTVIVRLFKKLRVIMPYQEWKKLPTLSLLMILAGFFEILSVSLMLPFMNIVVNRKDNDSRLIKLFRRLLHLDTDKNFLISIALLLAMVFILKGVYLLYEVKYQQTFVANARFGTQRALLESVLGRPYEYFMDKSTATIHTIVVTYVSVAYNLLDSLISLMAETVISGMLIITVFVISPKISFLIGAGLFLLMLCITRAIKPNIKKASDENRKSQNEMSKWIMQSIQGIKEVKIAGSEEFFLANYNKNGKTFVETNSRYVIFDSMPRLLIETATMSAFFVTVALHIARRDDLTQMLPVISVIAMAAVRLLPAINRIAKGINSVAFSEPYVDELLKYMGDDEGNAILRTNKEKIVYRDKGKKTEFLRDIRMEHIFFRYPNGEEEILHDASICIKKGESIGIVGSSGAGKTTVVDIMLGLLNPQSGMVYVDDMDIRDNPLRWIAMVGYIPQSIFMLDDSIKANVAFGSDNGMIDDDRVYKALCDASLGDFIRGLQRGIDTQIGERGMRLSGGQRQRIGIARALYSEPQILFFDEATSALDNETEKEIMDSIKNLMGKKTIIIIAHRLSTIEACNHVYKVENGRIEKQR